MALVMSLYAIWALRQRQITLEQEARRATYAYATALGLALEGAFRGPRLDEVQEIVDRISQEREIYGVVVYGTRGEPLFSSEMLQHAPSPATQVRQVLASGRQGSYRRLADEEEVYSVVRRLRDPRGAIIGAFEVAQPLSFVEEEKARIRSRFVLNTATLLLAVTGVFLWLIRRVIARPLAEFLDAVQALGRGELTRRVKVPARGGELAELAIEFNQMADRLEVARADLVRETEERLALEQRLRQTEKMAAVGNLAAGLAHEIAAPLNVVTGRAEMLLKREMTAAVQEKNLRIIVDQIRRITVIIRNLLDFARRREPRLQPLDLADVLESVVDFLDGEFERAGIEVRRRVEGPLWITGDPHLLHQVFLNLLLNSVHALEQAEGAKTIWIGAEHAGPHAADGGRVAVTVRDNGPGIADEHLPQIFEPFFTTRSGGEGTGLGLAVARGIIEEHAGSIRAGNWEGGAEFRLVLPAAPIPEASRA